jgi:hypothetical protein
MAESPNASLADIAESLTVAESLTDSLGPLPPESPYPVKDQTIAYSFDGLTSFVTGLFLSW